MRNLKLLLFSVLLLACLAVPPLQAHRQTLRLRRQLQTLRDQARQCRELAQQNQRFLASLRASEPALSPELQRELLMLRGEVGHLRLEKVELAAVQDAKARSQNGLGGSPPPNTYLPKDSWGFAGYEDIDSAVQSVFWAFASGDPAYITNSMTPAKQLVWLQNQTVVTKMADFIRQTTALRILDEVTSMGEPVSDNSENAIVLLWNKSRRREVRFQTYRLSVEARRRALRRLQRAR